MTDADLYELLGVRSDASDDELKRAYRAKAREFHPDANQDDDGSAERFKEVSLAYEVLKDPERRARYDRFGAEGVFGPGAGGAAGDPFAGGLGDLFDAFFNGMGGAPAGPGPADRPCARTRRRDGAPARLPGGRLRGGSARSRSQTPVHCDTLRGHRCPARDLGRPLPRVPGRRRAAPGAPVDPRAGHHRGAVPALPGHRASPSTNRASTAGGEGRRNEQRTLTVDIPAGVDEGSTLRLSGHGPAGFRGGPNGALFVHVSVHARPRVRAVRCRPPRHRCTSRWPWPRWEGASPSTPSTTAGSCPSPPGPRPAR